MTFDGTLTRINDGVQLHHQHGRREVARDLFEQVWHEIGEERGDGNPAAARRS
ncbi:hypothetical protein [Micromonospora sp. NPDC049240]|uniref:hypothetical protein n=1 Tax=Micromonospora sp. NPDC049240 TaxID=3155151 RepID=UPI0033FBE2CA